MCNRPRWATAAGVRTPLYRIRRLLPIRPDRLTERGWAKLIAGAEAGDRSGPVSSDETRQLLGWAPSHRTLLADLEHGDYFDTRA